MPVSLPKPLPPKRPIRKVESKTDGTHNFTVTVESEEKK